MLIVLTIGLLPVIAGCGSKTSTPVAEINSSSINLNNVIFTAEVPKQSSLNTPAKAVITLRNQTQDEVFYAAGGDYEGIDIRICDERNCFVPRNVNGPKSVNDEKATNAPQKLAPGRSRSWSIDLAQMYDLTPGRYTVSVSVETVTPAKQKPVEFSGFADFETGPRLTVYTPFEVVKQ